MHALQSLLLIGVVLLAMPAGNAWSNDEAILASDPAAIRVALVVPGGYAIGAKGVNMRFALAPGTPGAPMSGFSLVEQASTDAAAGIAPPAGGSMIREYALAPTEVAALARLLQEIRDYRNAHTDTTGASLSIEADLCRSGDTPLDPALFSIYFRSNATSDYEPLEQDIDLGAGEAAQACSN